MYSTVQKFVPASTGYVPACTRVCTGLLPASTGVCTALYVLLCVYDYYNSLIIFYIKEKNVSATTL